jgi:hypothetical protein
VEDKSKAQNLQIVGYVTSHRTGTYYTWYYGKNPPKKIPVIFINVLK